MGGEGKVGDICIPPPIPSERNRQNRPRLTLWGESVQVTHLDICHLRSSALMSGSGSQASSIGGRVLELKLMRILLFDDRHNFHYVINACIHVGILFY